MPAPAWVSDPWLQRFAKLPIFPPARHRFVCSVHSLQLHGNIPVNPQRNKSLGHVSGGIQIHRNGNADVQEALFPMGPLLDRGHAFRGGAGGSLPGGPAG